MGRNGETEKKKKLRRQSLKLKTLKNIENI